MGGGSQLGDIGLAEQIWSQVTAVLSDAVAVEDHQLRNWWAGALYVEGGMHPLHPHS